MNNLDLQLTTKATLLLWLGWLFMIVGLFIPVIHIPIPDPDMARLLFLGHSDTSMTDEEAISVASHVPIEGVRIIAFTIITLLKKMSLNIAWLVLLLMSSPLLLAVTAPIQAWVTSRFSNMLLALLYGLGLILPLVILLNSTKDNVIGIGYYVWTVALLMLFASRILVFISSRKGNNE